MIDHIYIDNYLCFTNLEFKPEQFELLLGRNGSGKSTMFEVLARLRSFITDWAPTVTAFPSNTCTAWDPRKEQTFELGIEGNGGRYLYRVVVQHQEDAKKSRTKHESLSFGDEKVYEFRDSEVHLYSDDGSEMHTYPFDGAFSPVHSIAERPDNTRLTWFRERIRKLYIFAPDPVGMTSRSEQEREDPDLRLHEFVSWFRHLSQERMDMFPALVESLLESVDNFKGFRLEKTGGNTRELKIEFFNQAESDSASAGSHSLPFEVLSEGQRGLIALSTVIHACVQKDTTVCIDELDNYVALREIQPLLTLLKDKVEDESSQCFLVSHNPEVLNYLAAHHGRSFYRDDGGPTRVKRFEYRGDDPMLPSEVVAHGWD